MALLRIVEAYAFPLLSYKKALAVPLYQHLTPNLRPPPFLLIRRLWPNSIPHQAIATMITSVKAASCTKSAGLIAWPPNTKANGNDIPVLPISTHPNFRGSNKKKNKRQPWKRNSSCIRCGDTPEKRGMLQGSMYRRQVLLASTSLPLKPQQMLAAIPPPPNLTDYQKLANAVQEAEKLKRVSHGSQEINDAACWLSSAESQLKHSSSKSPDELSGIISVPRAQEILRRGINENEVITARVRRPGAIKPRSRDKEEQVVLQGIEVTNDKPLCFDVYIKLGEEEDDDDEELYAGTFSHMPPRPKQRGCHNNKPDFDGDHQKQKRARRCSLRLGMNDMSIHRHDQEESVTVKLVPTFKLDEDPIKVESIFID